ncbi:hypothetical protein LRB11_16075 [Ectothiorhodospira haloalkaliphila]|uniref:hypothetical protein n=1 Tax=Ectothiorhodospira haloalkaliphila TaxID=421628 RepID=UPI001EE9A208|nr:hypothetical protein [Ectothiorhodospira haloalkaliphila]MCG5526424.1 hypothetical protein [Ectothiorhodospira haloalkaliphila]
MFAEDNLWGGHKEEVGYTYLGSDGYSVLPVYLGEEGWCLTTQLKPESENSRNSFGFELDPVPPAAHSLTESPILIRLESAHTAMETGNVKW